MREHIKVNTGVNERLRINFNVTFLALECPKVELVAMDVVGEHQIDIENTVTKTTIPNPHKKKVHEGTLALLDEETRDDLVDAGACSSYYTYAHFLPSFLSLGESKVSSI
jgi:hypothetical protein